MNEWRDDAFLARYGHQDIHKLRGIDRQLTKLEKAIFAHCLIEHIENEVQPLDQGTNPVPE